MLVLFWGMLWAFIWADTSNTHIDCLTQLLTNLIKRRLFAKSLIDYLLWTLSLLTRGLSCRCRILRQFQRWLPLLFFHFHTFVSLELWCDMIIWLLRIFSNLKFMVDLLDRIIWSFSDSIQGTERWGSHRQLIRLFSFASKFSVK